MHIIEKIKKNELVSNPSEIQQICLDKLKLNPLPIEIYDQGSARFILAE